MDTETAASSDIEIISAINSTPSEALNQDQSNLWESDALSNALRELSGEMSGPCAMETLLHAREQKVGYLNTAADLGERCDRAPKTQSILHLPVCDGCTMSYYSLT